MTPAAASAAALCLGARVLDRKTASPGTIIEEVPFELGGVAIYYRVDLDTGGEAWPRTAKDLERLQ